jgi:hypothetical protein
MDHAPAVPQSASDDAPGLPEREPRRAVEFPAHLVLSGGLVLDVRVLDLSYDGCQVEVPKVVFEDDEVQLSVQGRGVIHATVRWCNSGRAGLKFAAEPATRDPVSRKDDRRTSGIEAQLRRIGNLTYQVAVRDISREGCQVDLVERPAIGEIMQLKLPGLETMTSRVRWVDDYVAGLAFEKPMHPAVFDLLLQRVGR